METGQDFRVGIRLKISGVTTNATFLLPIGNAASATFGQITGAVSSGDFGARRQLPLA